jgi:hypothetical protein
MKRDTQKNFGDNLTPLGDNSNDDERRATGLPRRLLPVARWPPKVTSGPSVTAISRFLSHFFITLHYYIYYIYIITYFLYFFPLVPCPYPGFYFTLEGLGICYIFVLLIGCFEEFSTTSILLNQLV